MTSSDIMLITHSRSWALLEEPPIVQPLMNLPAFYGARKFITAFTKALHWSPSWAISIQSRPPYLSKIHPNIVHPPTSWSSQWPLSFWLSHKYPIPLLPHSCYMPHLSNPSWFNHSNYIWRRVQVTKLLIMQFSPTPVTSSLFGPNILLNSLFSNTLGLCDVVLIPNIIRTH
jgi:hypothetical protein